MLLIDDIRTTSRSSILSFLAAAGIMLFIVLFFTYNRASNPLDYLYEDPMPSTEMGFFAFVLIFLGALSAARFFYVLKDKTSRINYLMLPATSPEKFISRFSIYIIIIPVMMIGCFELIDLIRYALVRAFIDVDASQVHLLNIFEYCNGREFIVYACAFLSLQSIYALGSAIWPNKAAQYTTFALIAFSILTSLWSWMLTEVIFDSNMNYGWTLTDDFDPETTISICIMVFTAIFCAVNYTIAYFRFKEIEIVQRW